MKTDKTTTKQDKEIKDRKGSQPATHYGKDAEGDEMAKSTKLARARHFDKGKKKSEDDPSAYKPAPGDKSAKTKPSKYTLKYKKMFGERRKQAVAGGKVQKLVTGFGLKYKGKTYKEIDMELKGIDNVSQMVTFNIIHPKEIFGNEIKLPFKTIRKGPFMATDTSKINEERKISFTKFYKDKKMNEGAADKSLKKKSEASGISFSILKKVYSRGVAAWRTGHRPGTTPEQWGHARVNSFITGGKTRTTGDADLWKQHKGVKEEFIVEDNLATLKNIVKRKQAMPLKFKDGSMKVDFQTASGLVRSISGGKIKPETMKKLLFVINKGNKLQFLRLVDLMYKK
jgi:hypothetical protein